MIQKRSVLWALLFTGVIVHMLNYSCINIAITDMVRLKPNSMNKTYIAVCLVERGNFSTDVRMEQAPTSAPVGEYEWEQKDKTILMGSFSWFMGLAQLVGGLLCQRYGGKAVFGISNLLLGVCSCFIPLFASFGVKAVIGIRCIQGIAGGSGIGVAAKALISKWVPPDERAKFLATMAGLYCGASFSYYLNGYVLHYLGWRAVFYTAGAITAVWCIIWHCFVFENPRDDPHISSTELMYIEKSIGAALSPKKLPVPWLKIFTSVPLIVNTLASIGVMWTTFTFLIYVPTYLKEIHGFPSYQIGQFSSIPFLLETLFAVCFATIADWLLRRKIMAVTNVRKFAVFFCTLVSGVLFACLIFGGCDTVIILGLLTTAVMFSGASIAGNSANIVDMSPNFCAIIHGLQGIVASSMGYVSPFIVGYLTGGEKSIENWNNVFLITGGINVFSGLLFFVFGDSRVQPWNYEKEDSSEEQDNCDQLIKHSQNKC